MPVEKINIERLFELQNDRVVIDVRTPAEFAQGHIIGAHNLPLFTDEERVVVGTIYKKQSPEKALLQGLEFTGKKMPAYIKSAKKIAPDKKLIVHCWRGGKRSGSMAWLLDLAEFDVLTIEGGYKSYRNYLHTYFEKPFHFRILGGKTGTGKTEILKCLEQIGEQVIDLEGLANHKGSAFGALGELPQPYTEHFENMLFEKLRSLDHSKPIWVENESRGIGKIFIPEGIWTQMRNSTMYNVEIPHELRLLRSVKDYQANSCDELTAIFKKIESKLGGKNCQEAIQALEAGDYTKAAEIALVYYDKTYQHSQDRSSFPLIKRLSFDHADMMQIAKSLSEESNKTA
ncbi:MAG: tRNA 2-selenouridine(34) synthase MnmH [Saprospiraceae bacterium]